MALDGQDGRDRDQDILIRQAHLLRTRLRQYFARRDVDRDELDDMVQEVFLRIARHGQLDRLDNIDSYMMRIAANVLIDRHRRRMSHAAGRHVEFDPLVHGDIAAAPDEELSARQALRRTTLLLLELPERTRSIFVLNRLEKIPNREIAQRFGISVSAVEKHVGRALHHLLANIEDFR